MTNEELNQMVKEIKHVHALLDAAQAQLEKMKSTVEDELRERAIDEWLAEDIKVTFKPVTSQRFDAKAFKLTHADLYGQYSRPQTVTRLVIR